MINWNQFPFVRILIPFASGILFAVYFSHPALWLRLVIPVAVVIYALLVLLFHRWLPFRYRWISGVLIHAILFMAGFQLTMQRTTDSRSITTAFPEQDQYYTVMLKDTPSEKKNSFSCPAQLELCHDSSNPSEIAERVMLYFQKDEMVGMLRYGDRLFMKMQFQKVKGPANPGEFNYRRHLKFRGITHQAFVEKEAWVRLNSGNGNSLIDWSKRVREHLLLMIRKQGIADKNLALASAVLLGYGEYIDDEQQRQFAGAGAMHILCVSGLHVGIIVVVLNSLLFFLNRNRFLKMLKLLLLILLIWIYAAITGLSPSVLRAATMFSFIYLGRSFNRKISIYNMLAASAFLLLTINPFMITKVGFQLSYLAVAGIVLLYKPLSGLVQSKYWLVERVGQLTIVSLVATIATFPLSIYYFNQFPNFFLITNLVAIPASVLIVYTGMLMLIVDFIPVVSAFIAKLFELILTALNASVGFIEGLPYATSNNIYITSMQLLVILLLVFVLTSLLLLRKKVFLFAMLGLGVILLSSFAFRKSAALNQCGVTIYQLRGHTAIEFFSGRESLFLCDSALLNSPQKIEYAAGGNRRQLGLQEIRSFSVNEQSIRTSWLAKKGNLIRFADRTFVLLDDHSDLFSSDTGLKGDVVLMHSDPSVDLPMVAKIFDPALLVLDASMPPWATASWQQECKGAGIAFHDVAGMGAFVMKFD